MLGVQPKLTQVPPVRLRSTIATAWPALAAVTAAVVGVIANLALWFALHVLFARVAVWETGPLRLQWPELASLDWRAALIAAVAFVLIFRLRWGIIATLCVTAAMGLALGSLA